MTVTLRRHLNPSLAATSLVLVLILFGRITKGLDLTDEMQYYGEIKGLIETGKLFSNDLFIQQSVYILLYPVFCLYHLVFGFDGFVFFGRLVLALLSVAVFLYGYRQLMARGFSELIASLTALSLAFAISYHGVFAPSYNTVSQVLWIVFTLKFFEWKQSSHISLGALPIIVAFAHPTAAVMMYLLIVGRLLAEREFRQIVRMALVFLGGALIAAIIFLNFAAPEEYLASLHFSSGYGVGTTFFSGISQPLTLLAIYAMFLACPQILGRFHRIRFAWIGSVLITGSIVLFSTGLAGGAYTPRVVYALSSLSAFAYAWSLSNIAKGDIESRRRIHWLVVALLTYATTLGVTSGNGIGQSAGAFMVGLPLLLGIAVSSVPDSEGSGRFSIINVVCVGLVFLLFFAHWSRYPYREVNWLQANAPIRSVPEFRFIGTSPDRVTFVQRMQRELAAATQGRHTLIVSEYPGLYFALGAHPETCMLYMHSLTSDKSEAALLNCLRKKQPAVVVDIFANDDIARSNSRIKNVMHHYYSQRGVDCASRFIAFAPTTRANPEQLKYFVCTKIVGLRLLSSGKTLIA